ncbi:MAG: hypothetical protein K2X50_05645 [Gammaproteobacteria bacterium]|nr:hypothetical protein [Gammaproteobacteria bacterium]
MKYYKPLTCILGLLLALTACATTTLQLEKKIGKPTYSALTNSKTVSVVKVAEVRKPPYAPEGAPKNLSAEQVSELREMLLNDSNYNFNRIKRCLFIPEISYQFTGDKAVNVYVSYSCKKIKIVSENNTNIIDYDPMAEKFNSFSKTIMKKSNTTKTS